MDKDTADLLVGCIAIVIAVMLACTFGFAVAMGVAWAVTNVWPSLPFWPVAVGVFCLAALFSRSSRSS